jgi:cell division protein FtsL
MVRVLNFFCVALMGLSILALYHVSEKTRVAHMELSQTVRQIAQERAHIGVLETEWQHVASPERIQQLAEARLGMVDSASAQLSSFDQLPRRGADAPAPGNTSVHNASAQVPVAPVPVAIPVSQTSDPGPSSPGM